MVGLLWSSRELMRRFIPEDRNPRITRVGEHVYLFTCDEGGHFFCFADQPDFEPPKEYYEEIFSCSTGGVRC